MATFSATRQKWRRDGASEAEHGNESTTSSIIDVNDPDSKKRDESPPKRSTKKPRIQSPLQRNQGDTAEFIPSQNYLKDAEFPPCAITRATVTMTKVDHHDAESYSGSQPSVVEESAKPTAEEKLLANVKGT